jgi:hypothetical protein
MSSLFAQLDNSIEHLGAFWEIRRSAGMSSACLPFQARSFVHSSKARQVNSLRPVAQQQLLWGSYRHSQTAETHCSVRQLRLSRNAARSAVWSSAVRIAPKTQNVKQRAGVSLCTSLGGGGCLSQSFVRYCPRSIQICPAVKREGWCNASLETGAAGGVSSGDGAEAELDGGEVETADDESKERKRRNVKML